MAVFDHIPAGEAGLQEVYQWVDGLVAANEHVARKELIGISEEGREIPAVFITDPNVLDSNKETAIITLARHGQEAGTRVVGPEIMNYLVSGDAKDILGSQQVIIIPVANPDGFIRNDFHSHLTRLTHTERTVLGKLFNAYPPDMMLDYHSLGKTEGSRFDSGDMEAIIPANTTRWAVDEQVHLYAAERMREAAEDAGYPFEIHSLEDTHAYYFGDRGVGGVPWTFLREKVFLLHMQDFNDNFDIPDRAAYTNYTCGPAYMKWHTLVFGVETNHWSIPDAADVAISGLIPCKTMLKLGCTRFPWEREKGYPVNILHGDFRNSIRPVGKNAAERRASRTRLWNARKFFNMPQREMLDAETTRARVRYFGAELPMSFALCLRMRQNEIKSVAVDGKQAEFETFRDRCANFLYVPITIEAAGTIEVFIKH